MTEGDIRPLYVGDGVVDQGKRPEGATWARQELAQVHLYGRNRQTLETAEPANRMGEMSGISGSDCSVEAGINQCCAGR